MKKGKILIIGIISVLSLLIGYKNLNAASIYATVYSASNTVVVGKTFNVSITFSSNVTIGGFVYTLDYPTSKLKLISGTNPVAFYGKGTEKKVTYSYSFKAIASGSAQISIKGTSATDWDTTTLTKPIVSAKTVNIITQAQLEASYSKDNNLKSLTVEGYTISPEFNASTTEYSVKLPSNVEQITIGAVKNHAAASVNGTGVVNVSEGENSFNITVVAENGNEKVYVLKAIVEDENPINLTIDDTKYTIVKRESSLTFPATFEKNKTTINEIEIPSAYSETTKLTIVGIKDESGKIQYATYDAKTNKYQLYNELSSNQLTIYPTTLKESDKYNLYKKSTVKINEVNVSCYEISNKSNYKIIYGINIENGKENYYVYDVKNKTFSFYNDEEIKILKKEIESNKKYLYIFAGETIVFLIIIISLLISGSKRKKKIKEVLQKFEKYKEKKEEEPKIEKKEKDILKKKKSK